MNLFDIVPKDVLGRLLPSTLMSRNLAEVQWPGGVVRCEVPGGLLPSKADLVKLSEARKKGNDGVPSELIDALDRSKAQIDAGRTVSIEPVLQRMRDSIARLEAKQSKSS